MGKKDLLDNNIRKRMNEIANDDRVAGTTFEIPEPQPPENEPPQGSIKLLVNYELIDLSADNVRKQADMLAYDVANKILQEMLAINNHLIDDKSDLYLYEVLVGDDDPFTDILKKYEKDTWASKLLGLAASIQMYDLIYPPVCRIVNTNHRETRYSLMDGMRRFLAMRLLNWNMVPILAMNTEQANEWIISTITNTQREDMDNITQGQAISVLMEREGLSQRKAAEKLGMTHKEIRWKLDSYTRSLQPKKEKSKEPTVRQVIKDTESGKIVYIGSRKLTKPEIKAFLKDIFED